MNSPQQVLRDVFGYEQFRGRQREAIEAALAGRDALVLMPTGGGKSLCFQIPALLREGTGLVVSPLIALMHDQVAALREAGVRAACLNSAQDPAERRDAERALAAGELDLVYVAPEGLAAGRVLDALAGVPVSIIAIDEAHCVSQWGHDFRQDYLELNRLAEWFPGVPRMALTATATPRTREDIVARLALVEPEIHVGGFDRPNIRYTVQPKTDARRQLGRFLSARRGEAGIVYCLSRKKTESTAEWLRAEGFDALPYHAGLSGEMRAAHQQRFVNDDGVVIVATIAFGMGIDKPDVRFVAHLDLPKSIEAYYQETGRAGRDGLPAEAFLLYGLQDVVRLRQMVDDGEGSEDYKRVERGKLDTLLGWCEVTACRRRPLLEYFGDAPDADCGNCDNCVEPPETRDGTEDARKLLSAVYRTGQRFGAGHVIDVLAGKATDKVARAGHDTLSVFGIGRDLDAREWRSVARQLVVRGYLRSDPERYGALALTDTSRELLRGEITLALRRDARPPPKSRRAAGAALPPMDAAAAELFEALRECRKRLATEHAVPPYVIFHDTTLLEMATRRPATPDELLAIGGVGQSKLQRYGEAFLDVLGRSQEL